MFALSRPGSPEQPIARVFPRTELPGQASALEWRLVAWALRGLSILSYLRGGISRIADPPIWDLPYTRPCSAVDRVRLCARAFEGPPSGTTASPKGYPVRSVGKTQVLLNHRDLHRLSAVFALRLSYEFDGGGARALWLLGAIVDAVNTSGADRVGHRGWHCTCSH